MFPPYCSQYSPTLFPGCAECCLLRDDKPAYLGTCWVEFTQVLQPHVTWKSGWTKTTKKADWCLGTWDIKPKHIAGWTDSWKMFSGPELPEKPGLSRFVPTAKMVGRCPNDFSSEIEANHQDGTGLTCSHLSWPGQCIYQLNTLQNEYRTEKHVWPALEMVRRKTMVKWSCRSSVIKYFCDLTHFNQCHYSRDDIISYVKDLMMVIQCVNMRCVNWHKLTVFCPYESYDGEKKNHLPVSLSSTEPTTPHLVLLRVARF